MDKNRDDFYRFDVELSDCETFFVGKIVALWGALEHEVFTQTLLKICPPGEENAALPKKMNNAQFSEVLKLWKTHVLDNAPEEHAEILKEQFDEINRLGEYRNALIHGMWDWQKTNPAIISTIRVHKNTVVEAHFTVDNLQSFYDRLGRLNFMIRYPGGVEDMVRARMQEGGLYISRRAASIFMDNPVADDLMPRADNKE